MTFLVERLSELRKHLVHLDRLRPRVSATELHRDLSLHNDVLFSLLTVCRLVAVHGADSYRRTRLRGGPA